MRNQSHCLPFSAKLCIRFTVVSLSSLVLALPFPAGSETIARQGPGEEQPRHSTVSLEAPKLPPLPTGVTELKFSDFFVTPVGERGLTLTEKLRGLDGKRARILGYMVRQQEGTPGKLLLAPVPVQLCEHDSEFADDLPPSTIHVFAPACGSEAVPYTPKLLLLTGTLSVGNREEADGRISVVRLTLDPPPRSVKRNACFTGKGAERLVNNF